MLRSRSQPADPVHYHSGLSGTLRWMGYWVSSRSANARRSLLRHWRAYLRPALSKQSTSVRSRVSTALQSSAGTERTSSYDTLADAVRQRQLLNTRG
jgi:hypothetical protein